MHMKLSKKTIYLCKLFVYVRKRFQEIGDKNFTEDHSYSKVFNRNTLKLSYSCKTNMRQLIMAYNHKLLDMQEKRSKCGTAKSKNVWSMENVKDKT